MSALVQAVQVEANHKPNLQSNNLFFKTLTNVELGNEEATIDSSEAFRSPAQGLACSNKHGCILVAFQKSFLVFRVEDVWQAQLRAENENSKKVSLSNLPHFQIHNNALMSTPTIVSVSIGEEYLAVNTNKNGCAFVVIFKLATFLNQKGTCKPYCELRGSGNPGAQIRSICWNPGENLSNVVAICSTDGSLILARIVSENTMENWVLNEGVQTICWSPKGKQLVAGKSDGNLSQLKMDLTEAKKIPGPGGKIPSSIFWNSTTQFVVLFDTSSEISVMVLDLVKGGPAHYCNFDDVFMSDSVSYTTQCLFIPVNEWKCIISTTNSSSEIVLFGKSLETEPWALLDIPDQKRAVLPVDNYTLGASVFMANSHNVVISESEQYPAMPILYVLSQLGTLYSFFLINSDPGAPKIITQVTEPMPNTLFLSQSQPVSLPISQSTLPSTPVAPASRNEVKLPTAPLAFTPQGTPPSLQFTSNTVPPSQRFTSPQNFSLGNLPSQPLQMMSNINIPTKQEIKEVKSLLQDRILDANASSDEVHEYQNLLIDIQKFEKRLANFKQMQAAELIKIEARLEESIKYFEDHIIEDLKNVENFVKDIEDTTNGQKEEVEILKEKMLYQFSHLEYAKSMVERTQDLRYMQLLRSQPMDPSTLEKFHKIETLYKYVRNQIKEAERHFFYNNKSEVGVPIMQQPTSSQFIYQTLANHSQIIRQLTHETSNLRNVLKMSKNYSLDESNESITNRSRLNTDEEIELNSLSISDSKSPKSDPRRDTASLEELIFGIRGFTLDKDSDDLANKPILMPHDKLEEIKKRCSDVQIINCDMLSSSVLDFNTFDSVKYKKAFKVEDEPVESVKSEQSFRPQATFNVSGSPSLFAEKPLPFSNFSTTPKTFQSGEGSFTEKSVQEPTAKDMSFKLPMPLKSFGSSSDTFKFTTGVDTMSVSGGNAPSSVNKESFSTSVFSVPELTTPFVVSSSKTEEPLPAPKFPAPTASSGSIFGLSSSPSTGSMGGSIFGGSGGLFSSIGSVVLGGVPPSVTVKSAITPPPGPVLQLSSSSSSTSDESSGEQKPPSTSAPTILSTPKPVANVGLWGVSSGSFTGQQQETKLQTSNIQQLKLQPSQPPNVSVAAASSILNTFQSVPVPLKNTSSLFATTPGQQKPTSTLVSGASSLSSILLTGQTTQSVSSTSFSGGATSTETSSPKTVVAAVTSLPPNRSIFGGISTSSTQSAEQTTSSTVGTTPSLLSSALSGNGMTSIFGSPPVSTIEKKEGLFSGGLGSGSGFGLLGSTPAAATISSSLSATTTSSSLFSGSFQAPPTTTASKPIGFSTPELFASPSVAKTGEDNLGGIGGTGNVTLAAPSSTQTPPQSPSTGLFRSAELTTPSATQTTAPATVTTTASSIFATPPSSISVFSGSSFGGIAQTTAPVTAPSVFGTPATSSSFGGGVFGTTATSGAAPSSAFGTPASPTPIQSPFAGGAVATSPTTSFGGATTTTNPVTSPFSSAVSNANVTSPFGGSANVAVTSPFGGGTPATGITSPGASIFGGSAAGTASPASAFGGASNTTSTPTASIFGQSQPASVFGGSGSTMTSGFGAAFGSPTAAQPSSSSVFGQPTTSSIFGGSKSPFGGATAFGSPSTFAAATAQPSASSVFGSPNFMGASPASAQPESIFGGSSFSGLGGKPATDATNRNVFGGTTTFGATPAAGIFGGTPSGQLGSGSAASGAGAFSSGAGVAQTGFGSPTAKPANPAFGTTAAFGSAPAFGSTPFGPAFGSTGSPSSTFGSATVTTGSIFGGGTQNSGPTFGALAQSTSPPSFGGFGTPSSTPFGQPPPQQQQQQQQQQQTSSFGLATGGSSFSSWR